VAHTGSAAATNAQVQAWLSDPTGDYANARSLNILGDTRGGGDTIDGGAGNDIIFGQGGSDTIMAGAGNDVLFGGTSADTFKWSLNDQGGATTPAADVIKDFNLTPFASGGDVLDLAELLTDEQANAASLDAYLHFSANGISTLVEVSVTSGGPVTQTITLENVPFNDLQAYAGGAGATDADIISKLLANGNLHTSP